MNLCLTRRQGSLRGGAERDIQQLTLSNTVGGCGREGLSLPTVGKRI